ncbi:MAG: hypothetical protein RBT16_02330, partial [Desulfococcus multivorans]|nr:hypothetical protein [Desulfococcus multivorans]
MSVFLLLILFLLIPLFWYNSRLSGKIEALDSQIYYTRNDIVKYKKIAKESESKQKKNDVINNKHNNNNKK